MRPILALLFLAVAAPGCSYAVVEPGHRGLMFDRDIGLHHEILAPGRYRVGGGARVDDYDITYSKRDLRIDGVTRDGTRVSLSISVIYRPIVSELYQLDTEEGHGYFDEVIGPEALSAARAVVATSTVDALGPANARLLEERFAGVVRQRTAGRHVEIADVVVTHVELGGRG